MANGLPDLSGEQPTGNITPGGAEQQAITEPKHRLQSAFADMVTSSFGAADPEYKASLRNVDNAIISGMQQRWWKAQDEQFVQRQGAAYKQQVDSLQQGYMDELSRASEAKDPHERMTLMNAAHGRMWSTLAQLDTQFFDSAAKFPNNPIINNRVSFVMDKRREQMAQITGQGQQTATQVKTEEEAGLRSAQAGESRAEAATKGGFYSPARGQAAERIPPGSAYDWLITQPGGSDELTAEQGRLSQKMMAAVPQGFAEYQKAKNTGNRELIRDVRQKFRETFFIDPEDLGTKEGEELLNHWRANEVVAQGLDDRAARIVFERVIAAGRGFGPRPGTTSAGVAQGIDPDSVADLQRTAGIEKRPQIGEQTAEAPGQPQGKAPSISLPSGAPPELQAQVELAQQMGDTRGLPEFNIQRAVQAMGGDTPEKAELAGRRAYDAVRAPKDWNPDPSDEVTEFATRLYSTLPTYEEATAKKGKRTATKTGRAQQKYLDGLSDRVEKIFSEPYKKTMFGLDRDDAIWLNLLFLHKEFLEKFPESDMSVEQMIQGSISNLGQRRRETMEKIKTIGTGRL
jgi:hypothetical protein